MCGPNVGETVIECMFETCIIFDIVDSNDVQVRVRVIRFAIKAYRSLFTLKIILFKFNTNQPR
jgi:hypothetical protein